MSKLNRWTELVNFDPCPGDPFQATSTPIYQTATFAQDSVDCLGEYDYTRSGNPTRRAVEKQIAKLEAGKHAFAFNSGIAALNAVFGLLKQGDHVIASNDLYGGTHRLLSQRLSRRGITFTLVDTTNLEIVSREIKSNTRLLLIETPSNPLQKISDIKSLAELAHQNNILLVVDNTFLSPWLQQPLLLSADIVIHSATKHLSGHSDITAGVVIVNDGKLANEISFIQNAEGSALAPFECWLLLRGIKTLGLRIEREQSTAEKIAAFLQQHALVKQVYYAGLTTHAGYELNKNQAKGAGSVISFTTGSLALSREVIHKTQLFTISVSFGSLNSLISLPCNMSHASIPSEERSLPADLVRLSMGIEDSDDLIRDLDVALSCSNKKTG